MRLIICGKSRSGTTITRKMIHSLPDAVISNECRIYNWLYTAESHREYITSLARKYGAGVRTRLSKIPINTSKNRLDWLPDIEHVLYGDAQLFGDKTGFFSGEKQNPLWLFKEGLDFKGIYIYRDGRDVVASGYRLYKKRGPSKRRDWQNDSVFEMSQSWAVGIREWLTAKKQFDNGIFLEIRFEDYLDNKTKILTNIANHLERPVSQLIRAYDQGFSALNSHRGYHGSIISNWRKEFSPLALDILHQLGYL